MSDVLNEISLGDFVAPILNVSLDNHGQIEYLRLPSTNKLES